MEYNAFWAGVDPGGLRNTGDIGILICYILDTINIPISQSDLIDIIQENGLANYFEVSSALAELIKLNYVKYIDKKEKTVEITPDGTMVSDQLSSELTESVKEKAVSAAFERIEERKLEKENPVVITKADGQGYYVNIRVNDGKRDLMSLSLFVSTSAEANMIRKNFYSNPEQIYSMVLSSAVGDENMIKKAFKEYIHE